MSVYRKHGSVVRWEDGAIIRIVERGVAVERDELFECYPDAPELERAADRLDSSVATVRAVADAIHAAIPAQVGIERLLVLNGSARHEIAGVEWTEESRRIHLSLVRGTMRVLVDLGAFEIDEIARAAEALARASDVEREPPPRLRLAPSLTAALLPSLAGLAPPNVRLLQTAGGIDGKGNEIVEARRDWPNWYRPSYRVRPVRVPLNLRLECDVVEIDPDRPVAVALLAPVDGLTMRVLVDDHRRLQPATVRLTRIDAVGPSGAWYPYGAGSFGAEMML